MPRMGYIKYLKTRYMKHIYTSFTTANRARSISLQVSRYINYLLT